MTVIAVFLSLALMASAAMAHPDNDDWTPAHATFYGDMAGGDTFGGACAYTPDIVKQVYGLETAALSMALFNNGETCGACFELQCQDDPQWCIPGSPSIKVTATNLCPPNYTPPVATNWCNPPNLHFDLSMAMFVKLSRDYHAGIIPVRFRRVQCARTGGIRFQARGNAYWIAVLVYNVAGDGDVTAVSVKGSNTDWIAMDRLWAQSWHTGEHLVGQSLSFRVTTSDGKTVDSNNVAPANWQFGQVFEGSQF